MGLSGASLRAAKEAVMAESKTKSAAVEQPSNKTVKSTLENPVMLMV